MIGNRKKTLALMSIYDPEGIVDDYIIYYLRELRKVATRIIALINGRINTESEKRLREVVEDVYIRQNKGFDFGAFKDVLENYLPPKILNEYQELILCNDTCFGPFISFEQIFADMDERNLEFWSINYRDNVLLPYYESYFMVFAGKALGLIKDFLRDTVNPKITKIEYAQGYEHSLSELIMQRKVAAGYFTSGQENYPNLDIYKAPDYAIRYLGLPFMKKRCFSFKILEKDNCQAALEIIRENTDYPIEYIFYSVKRCYGLDIEKNDLGIARKSLPHSFWKFYISRPEVIFFCNKNKKVYLYGKGYMSVFILARFQRYMNEFGGYIVSDEYYTEEMKADEMVYPLSMIDTNTPIIVALLENKSKEVRGLLRGYFNVVFLSIAEKMNNTEGEKCENT